MPRAILWIVACTAFAQAPATVTGLITDPDGVAYSGAFVQLKNTGNGATMNVASGEDGKYSIASVEPGTYDFTVNVPGLKAFNRPGIRIDAGQKLQLNARLEDGLSLRTLGEDPQAIVETYFNRPSPPDGPLPRTADGKPDLSGMWLSGPAEMPKLEMLPWAEALKKEREASSFKEHPMVTCLPSGPLPLLGPGFFKLVQSRDVLIMMFEGDTPGYRQVFLDNRKHPADFGPSWLGHSTATWDGDTLVIDTVGFHDRGWMDYEGRAHSDKLHTVQKLHRKDLGHLEIEITVDDPGAYTKSWTVKKSADLAPDEEVLEFICNENNKDPVHMVGK